MHAFDIMAEAKMRQWEQSVRKGDTPARNEPALALDTTDSLEKKLYHDIRATIVRAYMETGATRKRMLVDAENMQVQLNSRLEKSGYNIVSRMFSENIQALKSRASAAGQHGELTSMLENLE